MCLELRKERCIGAKLYWTKNMTTDDNLNLKEK